tara:strand:- start:80 stop:361 length:282 start_codon:yes stop_codon:yes gene_type:complete
MSSASVVNILVGDDHQVIFQGIETMLHNHEIINELDYAGSIEEITTRLNSSDYDLLVLDLNINGINSLDHVEAFRHIAHDLKLLSFLPTTTKN